MEVDDLPRLVGTRERVLRQLRAVHQVGVEHDEPDRHLHERVVAIAGHAEWRVRPIRRLVVITERGIEPDPGVEQRPHGRSNFATKSCGFWLPALSPSMSTNRKGKGRTTASAARPRIEAADRPVVADHGELEGVRRARHPPGADPRRSANDQNESGDACARRQHLHGVHAGVLPSRRPAATLFSSVRMNRCATSGAYPPARNASCHWPSLSRSSRQLAHARSAAVIRSRTSSWCRPRETRRTRSRCPQRTGGANASGSFLSGARRPVHPVRRRDRAPRTSALDAVGRSMLVQGVIAVLDVGVVEHQHHDEQAMRLGPDERVLLPRPFPRSFSVLSFSLEAPAWLDVRAPVVLERERWKVVHGRLVVSHRGQNPRQRDFHRAPSGVLRRPV